MAIVNTSKRLNVSWRSPTVLVVALTIVLGLVFAVWTGQRRPAQGPLLQQDEASIQMPGARVYPNPKPIPAFGPVDHNGQTFDLARLRGKWSFLSFGFTHCPDVCPMTLAVLGEVSRRLEQAGAAADTQFVFVSVDPKRDKPEDLKQYVTYFSPTFLGVTGAPQALRAFTEQLGVFYREVEQHGAEGGYQVEHSGSVVLSDPNGRLYAVFPAPHQPRTITTTYLELRTRSQAKPG